MTAALRHRILIVIAAYGVVLTAWFGFSRWLAPAIIASANPGYGSLILNRVIEVTNGGSPYAGDRAQPLA